MKRFESLGRRDALRLIGAAGIVASCGGDKTAAPFPAEAGAIGHPAGALDLTASLGFPTSFVALDDTTIFVADSLPPGLDPGQVGMIVGLPRDGGPTRRIASGQINPYYLCLDGDSLFWANLEGGSPETSSVQRVSRGGGGVVTVARTNGRVLALSARNGTLAYIVDEPALNATTPRLYVGFAGATPKLVESAPDSSSGPISAAADTVYWQALRRGDNVPQVLMYRVGSPVSQLALDNLPQIDVMDSRGVYLGASQYEARLFDGQVLPLQHFGIPRAVNGSKLGIAGYPTMPSGITVVDLSANQSQPLFPLEHPVLALAFDDAGVAWLEERKMFDHSAPPALFYASITR